MIEKYRHICEKEKCKYFMFISKYANIFSKHKIPTFMITSPLGSVLYPPITSVKNFIASVEIWILPA